MYNNKLNSLVVDMFYVNIIPIKSLQCKLASKRKFQIYTVYIRIHNIIIEMCVVFL